MKRFTSHIFIAVFTFAISVFGTTLFFYQSAKNEKFQKIEPAVESKTELPQHAEKVEAPKETEPDSLSPFDIESFINNNPQTDLNNVWEKLGVEGNFNGLPWREKTKSFLKICSGCEAETFSYNLDDEPGDEVLLRIADDSQEACRYLLFKHLDSEKDPWKLLGFIDHDFGRYKMPQHSFLLSGGKSFLVVKVQVQSGTGVAQYNDRLFTFQKEKLIELFDYTAEGHSSPFAYQGNRTFSGRVKDCQIQNGMFQIEIEFTVNYSIWDEEKKSAFQLWNKKQKAIYVKSLSSNQKRLDFEKSNITQKEINAIYNIDSSTDDDILKYNFEELKKIAHEKGKRSQWLREFLSYCKNSKEKIILQKILRK